MKTRLVIAAVFFLVVFIAPSPDIPHFPAFSTSAAAQEASGASDETQSAEQSEHAPAGLQEKVVSPNAAAEVDSPAAEAVAPLDDPDPPVAIPGNQNPNAVDTPIKTTTPNTGGSGNLTTRVPILVPAFRGLEPDIELTYDSSRKTKVSGTYQGWLGYGWGLDGFDVIERASPGYGVPAFDNSNTDVFLLNGVELVRCLSGIASPSCSTGGTHATENESYRRIRFDLLANEWYVTDRDGTVSAFRAVGFYNPVSPVPAPGTDAYRLSFESRWVLSSVTDTNGNFVVYTYACEQHPVCYPRTVNYNGNEIRFYRETRPDYLLMANGVGISQTTQRIKTIGIKVGGATRDAYQIEYDQAPFSNTSRVTRISRFGRNATVASDGTISGGLRKIVQAMTYQDFTPSFVYRSNIFPIPFGSKQLNYPRMVGDLNADGKDEIYGQSRTIPAPQGSTEHLSATIFNPDGTVAAYKAFDLGVVPDPPSKATLVYPGRFIAGKGTKDFAVSTIQASATEPPNYTTSKSVAWTTSALDLILNNCTGSYQALCNSLPNGGVGTNTDTLRTRFVADMDGDGTDEIHYPTIEIGSGPTQTFGDGFVGVVDMRGNGRQRGTYYDYRTGTINLAELVNGIWQRPAVASGANCIGQRYKYSETCIYGDINGDGATDLVLYNSAGQAPKVLLSNGRAFQEVAVSIPQLFSPSPDGGAASLSDFDNDGKSELVALRYESSGDALAALGMMQVLPFSFASAGNTATVFPGLTQRGSLVIGDFNGDGLADFVNSSHGVVFSNPGPYTSNILKQLTLETGGTVAIEYTPSSRWANDYFPNLVHTVSKLTVNDGRGGTVAVTDYAYGGGKYDPMARRSLGFRIVTATLPLANGEASRPTVDTYYRQDLASAGMVERLVQKDGAGVVRRDTVEAYIVNATARPYWAQNAATQVTMTENISLTTRVDRAFDAYNNLTSLYDQGRIDMSGDETYSVWLYAPNTSAYIVSLPLAASVWPMNSPYARGRTITTMTAPGTRFRRSKATSPGTPAMSATRRSR